MHRASLRNIFGISADDGNPLERLGPCVYGICRNPMSLDRVLLIWRFWQCLRFRFENRASLAILLGAFQPQMFFTSIQRETSLSLAAWWIRLLVFPYLAQSRKDHSSFLPLWRTAAWSMKFIGLCADRHTALRSKKKRNFSNEIIL